MHNSQTTHRSPLLRWLGASLVITIGVLFVGYECAGPVVRPPPVVKEAHIEREAPGADLLLVGWAHRAAPLLQNLLQDSTGESGTLAAIHRSTDAALLTNYSAAELENSGANPHEVLLALEAADHAWRLGQRPAAAWNRALAISRIGIPTAAARAWSAVARIEQSAEGKAQAASRRAKAEREIIATSAKSAEGFFYRELVQHAIDQLDGRTNTTGVNPVPGDHLAADSAAMLAALNSAEEGRAREALASWMRGRAAFRDERYEAARAAFVTSERKFARLRLPLQYLARDQRIRCQCSRAEAACLGNLRRFRAELVATGRYPWLAARAASAEGQTLFRAGRIYEAAEALERARTELQALQDAASESLLHSQIANAFAAAGETELALSHYLDGIRRHPEGAGDWRRKQLEDVMFFTLQQGYVATSETLLDELAATPATEAARVMEASFRGVVAARRGDARAAAKHFDEADALVEKVPDPSIRAEVARSLAIASAGSRAQSAHGLAEVEAAIAQQREQNSIWLPSLLVERGAALEERHELARAEADYLRAIEILAHREPRIDATMLSLGVSSERDSAFDRLIRLYLRQRRIEDALAVAERSAVLRISSLHARSLGLRDVYEAARDSSDKDVVERFRGTLRPGEAAVAYHLLRNELVTWVVTREEVFVVRRGVQARRFLRDVEELLRCASRGECAADRVSDLLLRDWIERVPRETTLLIQPIAELQAVPFAMLRTRGGERLLARNATIYAPSFQAFLRAARNDVRRRGSHGAYFAAAARPGGDLEPLSRATNEVVHASQWYRGAVVDAHASRARFLEQVSHFGIVHFAGHVLVNEEQPLLSALVFERGDDGTSQMLYAHELEGREFARARLVVLSACETGRTPRPTMSVANALLSQNVPSVVYTLWPVDDEASERFAIHFHRGIAAGASRAEAVRAAQLALLRIYSNRPDRWAAFAIAGAHVPLKKSSKEERHGSSTRHL